VLIIDTLMDSSLQAAIKEGKASAFRFFMNHGRYYPDLVSPFPTMSVNVDSTLLTGVSCDQHKVPGLVWYNQEEQRIVNYGSHVRELYKLGLRKSMEDLFYNLNHVHLSKNHKTIHENLQDKGMKAGSINALLYRGNQETQLNMPFLLSSLTGINKKMKSYSPNLFSYGAMHRLNPSKRKSLFWQKYGFNDKFSSREVRYLIRQNKLADLTIAYFPNLDQSVHKNGRVDIKGIEKVDKQLKSVLNEYPTWEDALHNNIWIILGDNGQAWINPKRDEALIDLRRILSFYKIPKLNKGITEHDEVVLAVNERMSFIYTLDPQNVPLEDLAKVLQKDVRIDVIALKLDNSITVKSGVHPGQLTYHPDGDLVDQYGQSWSINGNHDILDLKVEGQKIKYGQYPDALARLYAPFFSHEGEYLIVSAKPGYEFIGEGSPTHVGGASHGGLHAEDSLVSMMISGTDSEPNYIRIIDLKDWLLSLLNK